MRYSRIDLRSQGATARDQNDKGQQGSLMQVKR